MSMKHLVWLATLLDYGPSRALVSSIGSTGWPPRERKRRKALQFVANALCNVVVSDRRYPGELRRHHPEGGRLVIDILERRCVLNDSDVETLGIVERLGQWLDTQTSDTNLVPGRISEARVDVDYTAAERNYVMSGRVWEMRFSLRSEIVAQDQRFIATSPECTAAVPYGTGSIAPW